MNKIQKKWYRMIQMKYVFIGAALFALLAAFFSYFSPLHELGLVIIPIGQEKKLQNL